MADHAAKVAKKDGTSRKPRKEKPRALRSIAPTAIPAGMRRALPAGPGEPLPNTIVMRLGERYGHDFSAVRMHRDAGSNDAAADFGAKAYTVGTHVVFAKDRFAPGTPEGERLIAHELAHVVQQSRGGASPPIDSSAPHEHAAREAALRSESSSPDASTVAVAGSTSIGVARDEDEKKRKANVQKQIEARPPAKALPPGPISVEEVVADKTAMERLHRVAAGSAKSVKDISNVQGEIFEEVMNRDIQRRIKHGHGLQEILPDSIDARKLRFMPSTTDPAKLRPGEAMYVTGDRIHSVGERKPLKLSDGMILVGEKDGVRIASVFEGKSGKRRSADLHLTDPSKEELTNAEKAEKARVQKANPTDNISDADLGGQVRKTAERISPHADQPSSPILIDGKRVQVRVYPGSTRYLGVVPKDVDLSATSKALSPKGGFDFKPMHLGSTEDEFKVAASRIAEKAQAGKPWPLSKVKSPKPPKAPTPSKPPKSPKQSASKPKPPAVSKPAAPGGASKPRSPAGTKSTLPNASTTSPPTNLAKPPPQPKAPKAPKVPKPPKPPKIAGTSSPKVGSRSSRSGGRGWGVLVAMAVTFAVGKAEAALASNRMTADRKVDESYFDAFVSNRLAKYAEVYMTHFVTHPGVPLYANIQMCSYSEEKFVVANGAAAVDETTNYGVDYEELHVSVIPLDGYWMEDYTSASQGGGERYHYTVFSTPLAPPEFEDAVLYAKSHGLGTDALRQGVARRRDAANMPDEYEHWSDAVDLIDTDDLGMVVKAATEKLPSDTVLDYLATKLQQVQGAGRKDAAAAVQEVMAWVDAPYEDLAEHVAARGTAKQLIELRNYAGNRALASGQSGDGGSGQASHAYWSAVTKFIDGLREQGPKP